MAVMDTAGKVVVEKYDAREEGSDTSIVPETSESLSQTLGSADSPSLEDAGKGGRKAKSFASLFQDNRNPAKGMTLHKVDFHEFTVEVEEEEVDDVVLAWGYALVGYVAGGFPGLDAINRLRNSWKIPHKFSLHKSGWLVFKFDTEAERQKVLEGGPYMIYGRPLILKHMQPLFEFGACTASVIPTWILLPGLPIDLWNSKVLDKICSRVGVPLCTDRMTGLKERISYARVLVEVDIAKELVGEIPIKLPGGKLRMQDVIYENLPKFCTHCRIMGHVLENCRKAVAGKGKEMAAGKVAHSQPSQPEQPSKASKEQRPLPNLKEDQPGSSQCPDATGTKKQSLVAEASGIPGTDDVCDKELAPIDHPPELVASSVSGSIVKERQSRKAGEAGPIATANSFKLLAEEEGEVAGILRTECLVPTGQGSLGKQKVVAGPQRRITPIPILLENKPGKTKGKGKQGTHSLATKPGKGKKGVGPTILQ